MKKNNKVNLALVKKTIYFLVLILITTKNLISQVNNDDNLENWLNNNSTSMSKRMFQKNANSYFVSIVNFEYGANNYDKALLTVDDPLTSYCVNFTLLNNFSGVNHYNRYKLINEMNYFEFRLGYGKTSTGKEEYINEYDDVIAQGTTFIQTAVGYGKSYNKTKLIKPLFKENSVVNEVLNSRENSVLELGSTFGYEAILSIIGEKEIIYNNIQDNDGLERDLSSMLLSDYFKSFASYRITGNISIELGVKRNLIYHNGEFIYNSFVSKVFESGTFYMLDYFVTQPLLKSGDENTYIYNFLMQNAASLIFYTLKSDNYSFPLSGGKTYSVYNIYFGLRF